MPHEHTNENAAVAAVLLLRTIIHRDKPQSFAQQLFQLHSRTPCFPLIGLGHGVVVEGHAVDDGHEEEGPMRAAFGLCDVGVVIYRQEDVGRVAEVGEDFFEGEGLGALHEHVGHGGAEEDDGGFGEGVELFALEVFLPEGDCLLMR